MASTHAVGAAPIEKNAILDPHLELRTLSFAIYKRNLLDLFTALKNAHPKRVWMVDGVGMDGLCVQP